MTKIYTHRLRIVAYDFLPRDRSFFCIAIFPVNCRFTVTRRLCSYFVDEPFVFVIIVIIFVASAGRSLAGRQSHRSLNVPVSVLIYDSPWPINDILNIDLPETTINSSIFPAPSPKRTNFPRYFPTSATTQLGSRNHKQSRRSHFTITAQFVAFISL